MKFLTQQDFDEMSFRWKSRTFRTFPLQAEVKKDVPLIGYSLSAYDNSTTLTSGTPHVGLFVLVATVHDEKQNNFGKLIKFKNDMGVDCAIYLSNSSLRNGNGVNEMVKRGFYMEPDSQVIHKLQRYILLTKSDNFVPYVSYTGYSKAFNSFVLPDGLYNKDGKKLVVYDQRADDLPLDVNGSYTVWKNDIASHAVQYPIPAFALIVPFSSLLFPFVDLGTIFTHFYGLSSRGKTLLLQLAASVFGNGSDPRNSSQKSLISQWNATPVGLEGMAALYNGSIGLLDEIHKCDDKDFPNAIYALCGGINKARGKSTGALREQKSWVFPGLSSGEQSGLEKIAKTKEEATLGRLIRFLDIHIDGQIFTGLDDIEGERLATQLKGHCSNHYGHAARDFMQQLLNWANDYDSLRERINQEKEEMFSLVCPPDLSQAEVRVMHHFALFALAGRLAVQFNILPMTQAQVLSSVCHVRDIWLASMKAHHDKLIQQQAQKRDYVAILKDEIVNNLHLYQAATDTKPRSNCKGYYQLKRHSNEYNTYLLKPETFEEIFKGNDLDEVCEQLCEKKVLLRASDQFKRSHRISSVMGKNGNSASVRLYTITADIIDDPEETLEPELVLTAEERQLILEQRQGKG
ncbi:DUF927 domain-containing protein [Chromatium okenii]|jgi:uncharacterized protein (DUF927 family)|uniref:DUF927 domain-containing protein n=1 Tax=Chromatium okenii TaxID=61644 RepID=A0A2S7XTH2_9GAMM|nr:DUF927 domain-containing protein [Chromatium okenii]MBV5309321.1 DUF927 domain-containing protein [Chromatium okenii]PQJ96833.1 hypothetical protein CXB77_05305 [Chromatium okenii]